ncbi:MAG: Maf family protein [Defluviitaleaceae bacterium]|nr:Maf family protein [Defluviitaleaceae bacterium]
MGRLILASASPRRKQLLEQAGVEFEVIESCVDENIRGTAEEMVAELALRKARAVAEKIKGEATVIGADTLVSIDSKVLEKPATRAEAFEMLKSLEGRKHTVYTGVAIIKGGVVKSFVESADVFFRPLTDAEIYAYIDTGEPFDKAGGYGIQGRGALLVEGIEGDFYTVMGLPLCRLFLHLNDGT